MILAIDIGNSNIVMGGYAHGALSFETRLSTDRSLEADQYALELAGILKLYGVAREGIERAIISSVVPRVTAAIARAVKIFSGVDAMFLSKENADVAIHIDNPAELGNDILATAVIVKERYALPAIVIDMGTATTLTAIGKDGGVEGVSIFPGLFISLDALTARSSQLGGIAIEPPRTAIGKNTACSMQSGLVFGTAAMLDGMLARFEAELGAPCTCVATGGAAGMIVPHCTHKVAYAPTLLLDGLHAVAARA